MLPLVLAACTAPGPVGTGVDTSGDQSGDEGDGPGESGGAEVDSGDSGSALVDSGDSGAADTGAGLPADALVIWALRHAEKEDEGDDPGLTPEGQARAAALVPLMAAEPLAAIYATDLQRTQQTVEPTAADHGLPVLVDEEAEDEFAAFLVATHPGETVLHCGHSYTLPDFFEALGLDPVPTVDDYGQLWEVLVGADGSVSYSESRFGDE